MPKIPNKNDRKPRIIKRKPTNDQFIFIKLILYSEVLSGKNTLLLLYIWLLRINIEIGLGKIYF